MRQDETADLVTHLEELRNRIIRILLYVVLGSTGVWFFYRPIFELLMGPINAALERTGGELIVMGLMEGFLIKCEIALVAGIIVTAPLIYYEVWGFIAPGLTVHERRTLRPLVPVSGLLFLMGVALAYFITGPSVRWLLGFIPSGARARIALNDTLLFVLKFYVAFGLGFQLPIILIILARLGIVDSQLLTRRWREAVIVIAVIAAIITPTWDPLTMTVVAIPMTALYLGTIAVIKLVERGHKPAEPGDTGNSPAG